ncbi:MAG: efflux transporter periplasmic adaptor subunit, partial [Acidocella sp. 20-61-6]
PNEFVNLHLTVKTLRNVPLVPAQAVQSGAPGNYVYVVGADNTVSVQTITPGITDGINTVIRKGLTPGQVVVTDGVDRLTNGMKVTIATAAGAPGSSATPHKKHLPPAVAQ